MEYNQVAGEGGRARSPLALGVGALHFLQPIKRKKDGDAKRAVESPESRSVSTIMTGECNVRV